jgi:hypothetical protein
LVLLPEGFWFLTQIFYELLHVLRTQLAQLDSSECRDDVILRKVPVSPKGFVPDIGRADRFQPRVQELRDRLLLGFGREPCG